VNSNGTPGTVSPPSRPWTIWLLFARDHPVVRDALAALLAGCADFDVTAHFADGEAPLDADSAGPDVAVIDTQLIPLDKLAAVCRQLLHTYVNAPAVLLLAESRTDGEVVAAICAGVRGYVLKSDPTDALISAVQALAAGGSWLSPKVARHVLEQYRRLIPAPAWSRQRLSRLSERELAVLRLIAMGKSNAEIAADLVLRVPTVKTHVSNILSKLGVRDRVQASAVAYRTGFVNAIGDRRG
jgi:DNA-binding NarL/FixJ family response regulator